MKKEVLAEGVELMRGDCRDILPSLRHVDALVTDPPYPDQHTTQYQFDPATVELLLKWIGHRPALIFWTSKMDLACAPTAIHIWDKKTGCGSEYERIYELNGQRNYKVLRHYLVNSTVAASYTGDVFTGHPSQKPLALMLKIIGWLSAATILDPFMGAGTAGVACVRLGRKFIGIEIEPNYFDIACKRISSELRKPSILKRSKPARPRGFLRTRFAKE